MTSGPRSLAPLLVAARHDRRDLQLADFSIEQARRAVAAGLGAWLRRCTSNDPVASQSPTWPLVHGADLTARLIVSEQLDALEEIVDRATGYIPPLTLLKGISICSQYYPEPHLRTMGDLDILVDEPAIPELEARLIAIGYHPRPHEPAEFYEIHHHTVPLFHPRRQVWVELHRDLFPSHSPAGQDVVFSREQVQAETEPALFRGQRMNRLSDDLQLVYVASHWAFGFKLERGMIGMLDVSRLLEHAALRWPRILDWLDNAYASTYVYLLLTYLARRGLADLEPSLLEEIRSRQHSFGRVNLAALHAVIDRNVVGGQPFDRIVSHRTFVRLWRALLSPGRPSTNVLRFGWDLVPSRNWFRRLGRTDVR